MADSTEPSFRALLLANLRVFALLALAAALLFGVWYGLAKLFPDVAWLQVKGGGQPP